MARFMLSDGMTGFEMLDAYRSEELVNGVYRDTLVIEMEEGTADIPMLYRLWENEGFTSRITLFKDSFEEVCEGYTIPARFIIQNREIERETRTTAPVTMKVVTMILAMKTPAELKADPSIDVLAEADNEIISLRNQVDELTLVSRNQ